MAEAKAREAPAAALTPEQRAKQDREDALLERALTGSPDYEAALRRAAVANVGAGRARDREQRIAEEEARLSDAVELRRRDRLAAQGRAEQAAQANAARAAAQASCDAQAAAAGAGTYRPYRPGLGAIGSGLTGAISSSFAEEQARQGCYRAYGL
jgi:hypothetical protein